MSPRRCHWYDENGKPRTQRDGTEGCKFGKCHFVHPGDRDWDIATTSPHPLLRRFSRSSGGYQSSGRNYDKEERDWQEERDREQERSRERERQRERDLSPARHPLTSTSTVYNISAPTRDPRRASLPSISSGDAPSTSALKATTPTSAVPRSLSLNISSNAAASSSNLPPVSPVTTDPRRRALEGRQDSIRSSVPPSPSDRRMSSPVATSMAPPPVPYPYKSSPAAERKGKGREDALQTWIARIKQMAEAVTIRTQHVALEKELTSLRALANSRNYSNISEAARSSMDKQIAETEAAFNAKKKELNSLVYKLVDTDFWPAPPVHPDFYEKGEDARQKTAEDRFQELRTTVWTLTEGVKELNEMVKAVQQAQTQTLPSSNSSQSTGEQRPGKRRRLSDADGQPQSAPAPATPAIPQTSSAPATPRIPPVTRNTPQTATTSTRPTSAPSAPAVPLQEFDAVKDRLEDLEGQLADVENSMLQFNDEILMELQSHIEDRLEDKLKKLKLSGALDGEDAMQVDATDTGQQAPAKPTTKSRIERLETEVIRVGKDIEGIVQTILEIMNSGHESKQQIALLTQENAALKARVVELEAKQEQNVTKISELQTQLTMINEALGRYMSERKQRDEQEAAAAAAIGKDVLDPVAATVNNIVLSSVRTDVRTSLEEQRVTIQGMLDEHSNQLSQSLMGKLTIALQAVATIDRWMTAMTEGEEDGSASEPIPVNPPG